MSVKHSVNDAEDHEDGMTYDDGAEELTLDEHKAQLEAKRKRMLTKLPKLQIRQADEGVELKFYPTLQWVYRKNNDAGKKWQLLNDYIEEEATKKAMTTPTIVETDDGSHDFTNSEDNQDKADEDEEQSSIPIQTEHVLSTTEFKEAAPQHPYFHTQFSDDFSDRTNHFSTFYY
ncbi:unnamed protein product [Adineta ricciae]|nr:unnamed protein product [Adineta ricciae]